MIDTAAHQLIEVESLFGRACHMMANGHQPVGSHHATVEPMDRTAALQALSCQQCGETTETEAHHPDYSQPLAVQWLCVPCHRAHHRKTHCKHGHEYTPENTYFHNGGKRHCGECARIRSRKYHHAKKSLAKPS